MLSVTDPSAILIMIDRINHRWHLILYFFLGCCLYLRVISRINAVNLASWIRVTIVIEGFLLQ